MSSVIRPSLLVIQTIFASWKSHLHSLRNSTWDDNERQMRWNNFPARVIVISRMFDVKSVQMKLLNVSRAPETKRDTVLVSSLNHRSQTKARELSLLFCVFCLFVRLHVECWLCAVSLIKRQNGEIVEASTESSRCGQLNKHFQLWYTSAWGVKFQWKEIFEFLNNIQQET